MRGSHFSRRCKGVKSAQSWRWPFIAACRLKTSAITPRFQLQISLEMNCEALARSVCNARLPCSRTASLAWFLARAKSRWFPLVMGPHTIRTRDADLRSSLLKPNLNPAAAVAPSPARHRQRQLWSGTMPPPPAAAGRGGECRCRRPTLARGSVGAAAAAAAERERDGMASASNVTDLLLSSNGDHCTHIHST